jgi:hypothetical protein
VKINYLYYFYVDCNGRFSARQSSVTVGRIKTPEDGRLWPKHVVLALNGEYFNDCCITDGLDT